MIWLDKKPVKQKPGMKGPFCYWKAQTLGLWNFFNDGASPSFFLRLGGRVEPVALAAIVDQASGWTFPSGA